LRSKAASLLAVAAALIGGCNQTPTEITPLPRALGEVTAVNVILDGLVPLEAALTGTYVIWGLADRSQATKLGIFYVDPVNGDIVDEGGNPIASFTSDDVALRKLQGILVTIEVDPQGVEGPTGMQVLSGTFIDRVASLTVPISTGIVSASGNLRVYTPTDGPDTNENSGVWMVDLAGEPSLSMPDTTAALQYETFIEVRGQNLNLGRFDLVNTRDDFCRFCASFEEFPQPLRPGDDLLLNAPDGLVFPIDLSGATVRISLEGRVSDFVTQSQLIVLEAVLPSGLRGDEIVGFTNLAANFPTGRAVLY
jgi:hypothetical protein